MWGCNVCGPDCSALPAGCRRCPWCDGVLAPDLGRRDREIAARNAEIQRKIAADWEARNPGQTYPGFVVPPRGEDSIAAILADWHNTSGV